MRDGHDIEWLANRETVGTGPEYRFRFYRNTAATRAGGNHDARMEDMGRRGRNGWRWLITALVIGVAAVGLGVVLRAQNLGAAANVAQLLSLLPLVASMLAWARERHKTPDAPEDENKTLNELIDTIEERVARVENSIAFHNALRSGLLEMQDRLTSSIAQLTGERRSLRDRIEAGHPGPPAGAPGLDGEERERPEDEVTRLRGALRETERGLKGAERMRGQVHRRLEESERRRTEADRLLREAHAHATEARRRLTELGVGRAAAEVTPAPVPRPRVLLGAGLTEAGLTEAGLTEEAGERTTDEILRRVDDVLRKEATVLRRVHGDLAGGALPVHRRPAGLSARRRVRWVTAGVGLPVVGLVLAVVVAHLVGTLPGAPEARSTAPARPQGPAPDPARTNLWPRKVGGPIEGDPAVADGVVYIGSSDSKVYALDAATGAERWSYQTANIVRSSPAVADGVVYVGSKDFTVYALDATTGEKRWATKTGGVIESDPAVAGGVVYVGSNDSTVYALDAATGAGRWSYETGDEVDSGPTVTGGVVYVGGNDFTMYALDAATGRGHRG